MEGTQLQANGKAFIGALSFEDPDSENEFEFLLGGKDSQLFELKGFPATKSGVLYTKSVFDYDDAQENAYEISVTINDGSAGEGTTSHFTVTVTNDNDENPTNCNLQGTIFDENSVNVVIGSFSFEDPDPNDEEDKVSFTSQHDFFKYVNSTIIITKPLDYESEQPGMGPLFPVKFSVNDGDNEKLECAYELTLKDVNDNAPTKMTFTPGENSDAGENQGKAVITVSEAANAGEVVTKITFEDADRNCKQQNFVLESSDAWAKQVFSIKKSEDRISSATGSFFELVMKNNTMLDHEIKKSYDMVLILSDGDSQHALKQRVTVNIQDANDVTPSEIEIDENAISEDAPIGTIVGVITFKDLDSIGEYSVTFVNEEDGETFSISENHNADPETPASFTLLTKKTFSAHTKKDYKVSAYVCVHRRETEM